MQQPLLLILYTLACFTLLLLVKRFLLATFRCSIKDSQRSLFKVYVFRIDFLHITVKFFCFISIPLIFTVISSIYSSGSQISPDKYRRSCFQSGIIAALSMSDILRTAASFTASSPLSVMENPCPDAPVHKLYILYCKIRKCSYIYLPLFR